MINKRGQELEERASAHLEKYPDDVEAVQILADFAVIVEREVWKKNIAYLQDRWLVAREHSTYAGEEIKRIIIWCHGQMKD